MMSEAARKGPPVSLLPELLSGRAVGDPVGIRVMPSSSSALRGLAFDGPLVLVVRIFRPAYSWESGWALPVPDPFLWEARLSASEGPCRVGWSACTAIPGNASVSVGVLALPSPVAEVLAGEPKPQKDEGW